MDRFSLLYNPNVPIIETTNLLNETEPPKDQQQIQLRPVKLDFPPFKSDNLMSWEYKSSPFLNYHNTSYVIHGKLSHGGEGDNVVSGNGGDESIDQL
jgi:hypothetical protein